MVKKVHLNVGAILILPKGFQVAPNDRLSNATKEHVGKLYFQPYSDQLQNILVIGPVSGKKYSEMTFPILSPKTSAFLKYPIYVGGKSWAWSSLSRWFEK
jgi:apocytochrome f